MTDIERRVTEVDDNMRHRRLLCRYAGSLLGVVFISLALLLAGCGGRQTAAPSGKGGAEGATSSSTGSTAPAQGGQPATRQPSPSSKTLTLKVADSFPPTHWMPVRATQPWMKRVEELTGGRVKFEYYPAEQLGKMTDLLSLLSTRVADIAYTVPTAYPGDLPLSGIASLPGAYGSSVEGQKAYAAVMKEGPILEEYLKKGVRPIFVVPVPPYEMFGTRKSIHMPADVKGLKVRVVGGTQSLVVEALGGSPVSVPTPDLYTALQRGTVDAAIFYHSGLKEYKLDELVKNGTYGAALTGAPVVYSINEEVWRSLDTDIREAMLKAIDEIMPKVAASVDQDTETRAKEYEAKGIRIFRLNEQEKEAWRQALAPVRDKWIKDMEAKGLPVRQVLEAWEKAKRN